MRKKIYKPRGTVYKRTKLSCSLSSAHTNLFNLREYCVIGLTILSKCEKILIKGGIARHTYLQANTHLPNYLYIYEECIQCRNLYNVVYIFTSIWAKSLKKVLKSFFFLRCMEGGSNDTINAGWFLSIHVSCCRKRKKN